MWNKIIQSVKGVMQRMGLLKSLEKITDHKDISLNEDMFKKIEIWKALYAGYYGEWHDITYNTVNGIKERTMSTLGIAKVASEEMASLVYNEKCSISIDNTGVSEFIEEVFKNNKFDKKFQDFLEYSFAHGGMVIKPYVENDKMMLSFVTADCFIPVSWRNDSIYEAVFPFEFMKRDKKYTHLEWHLWENDVYVIRNEVYESQNGIDLGAKVPLKNFFPDLEEEVHINGLKRSIFSYFKPNSANNIDTKSPLGISIYANALDTMKALDTAFDSLHREFRLGKKRIIVPAHMLKVVYDENGEPQRYFDANDEAYEGFNGEMDENKIQETKVELRVEEHINAINALLNLFAMQTGFSAGTFTFDGQSMKTATEVVSEQSKTFKSKKSHEVIIEAGLQELIGSIVVMGELYGMISTTGDYEVTVAFDDSIVEDKKAELDKAVIELTNRMKPRYLVISEYYGITEKEAKQWIKEMGEEERQQAPEVDDLKAEGAMFGVRE